MKDDEIAIMISDCETRESRLSDWEREFIDSVGKQYAERGTLSQKQRDRLEQVWEKATERG